MDVNVEKALKNISFIERFEYISEKYSAERLLQDNLVRLYYFDGEEIMKIIKKCGYDSSFDKKEKFFKIKEELIDKYVFSVQIKIRDGLIDLLWLLKENDIILLGSPLSSYSRSLIDINYRIKNPVISDYEDIEEILRYTFEMYQDFKKEYLRIRFVY